MSLGFARNLFSRSSFFTEDMALSHLDYANLLLFGCSASNMAKLTMHTKYHSLPIVLNTQRLCPARQLLCHSHWLPVHSRISYKISTLTYKVLAHNQLLYILVIY